MSLLATFRQRREQIFPLVLCLVLPWLEIINSSPFRKEMGVLDLFGRWASVATFTLILWYGNAFVFQRFRGKPRVFLLMLVNLAIMGIIMGLQVLFLRDVPFTQAYPLWLVAFRVSIAAILFIAILGNFEGIRQNERLKTENFALQTENYRAQLAQLKKQVNPHFLFNSLSTLQGMIRAEDVHSEEFVHNLSDVYRQLLQTRESHVIHLEEELDFLQAYLYLLKRRHQEGLSVEIEVTPSSLGRKLPTFALQLLLENATKHNVISRSKPLSIRVFQKDPSHITVTNNLQRKKNVRSMGVGLENLQKRYELMGISDGVQVEEDEETFAVTLTLL